MPRHVPYHAFVSIIHASQFFFHIDLVQEWDFDLFFRLNKILPPDIAVFDIIPMQGLCHARFDAVERTYDYFIHTYKDPFLGDYSALYAGCNFDLDKMKLAIALLPQYKDYRAFCKSPDRNDHTLCNVMAAELFADATGDRLRFRITANRFLSKMVRSITGRLLEVGKGAISVDEFESYLIHTETPRIIIPAYPQGLYLSKVTYPYLDIPARAGFSALLQNTTADTWQVV